MPSAIKTPLRDRRRAATRQEIHEAAVALVLQRGANHVTVEDIASAAGVSPRTFFNYFPAKRDALVIGPRRLDSGAVTEFVTGTGTLAADLRSLLVGYAETSQRKPEELQRVRQLVAADPELWSVMCQRYADLEADLAAALSQRAGVAADDFAVVATAAMATTLLKRSVRHWIAKADETSLGEVVSSGFDAVQSFLQNP